jgi:hypothetical protein
VGNAAQSRTSLAQAAMKAALAFADPC